MKRALNNICTHGNDYTFEIEIRMGLWLNEHMSKNSKRLSKGIYPATSGFITCNHTVMHSYLTTAETGNINR